MENRLEKRPNKLNFPIKTEDYILYLKNKNKTSRKYSNEASTKSLTKKHSNINLCLNDNPKSYRKNDAKKNIYQNLINTKDLKISQLKKEINSIEKKIITELKSKNLYSRNTYNPKQKKTNNIKSNSIKNSNQILQNFANRTSIFRNFSKKNFEENQFNNSSNNHYKTDDNDYFYNTKPINQKTNNKNNFHSIFLTKTNINFFKQKKEKKIFQPIYYCYTNNNISVNNNIYSIPLTPKNCNSIESYLYLKKNNSQKGKTRNKSVRKNDINFSCSNSNGTLGNKNTSKKLTINKNSCLSRENEDNYLTVPDPLFLDEKQKEMDSNFDNIQKKLNTVINNYFAYYEAKNNGNNAKKNS